jgi:hypothetical protein
MAIREECSGFTERGRPRPHGTTLQACLTLKLLKLDEMNYGRVNPGDARSLGDQVHGNQCLG